MPEKRALTPLGVWLEKYLAEHQMSERELAKRMEFSHAQISRVKYGDSRPSPKFIRKLSYATGAPENDLLITAFGQQRIKEARAGAKRITDLSSASQEVLRGLALHIARLPLDEQRLALDWFKALATMSQSNRTKAIREITAYLQQ